MFHPCVLQGYVSGVLCQRCSSIRYAFCGRALLEERVVFKDNFMPFKCWSLCIAKLYVVINKNTCFCMVLGISVNYASKNMIIVYMLGKSVLSLNIILNKLEFSFTGLQTEIYPHHHHTDKGQLWEVKWTGVRLISPLSANQLQYQLETMKDFWMGWTVV